MALQLVRVARGAAAPGRRSVQCALRCWLHTHTQLINARSVTDIIHCALGAPGPGRLSRLVTHVMGDVRRRRRRRLLEWFSCIRFMLAMRGKGKTSVQMLFCDSKRLLHIIFSRGCARKARIPFVKRAFFFINTVVSSRREYGKK